MIATRFYFYSFFFLCSCIFNQLPTTQKKKKTQKVFERSHRSWKRLIEERDKMANTHTVYVYYYNEWSEREFTGTRYTREPQRTKKSSNNKKRKRKYCAWLSFFFAPFFFSFLLRETLIHTFKTTKKYIWKNDAVKEG